MTAFGQLSCTSSDDPRVKRTRDLLCHALMQLLDGKDWGEISTSEICRRAGVARSSFYEHYQGKADLLDELFAGQMQQVVLNAEPGAPLGGLDWLCDQVGAAPEFFARAMSGGRGDSLLPRFRAALAAKQAEELAARGIADAEQVAAYIIGGSMGFLGAKPTVGAKARLQEFASGVLAHRAG